ncbi:hypothetical protein CWR48_00335 [Oceanobacillus arenosus]|uniref:Uncharacterized protein n=1 Tax=Oceanobacillus arenosus TaxID=1229153 RepID=A0A3D8Q331_9BACI|nr:hypothetical protein [Oceanobacillus arenosus]RDW22191.1 hypothetical protein CWR48_00335 [Oceanobacillus arenosus]
MNNNKLVVITAHESDFLQIVKNTKAKVVVIKPSEIADANLDLYDSIAVLGGGDNVPLLLEPRNRRALEEQIKKGKKTFVEYMASIGNVYFSPPESTRYERLAYCSSKMEISNLELGTLIDDQCGMRIKPHMNTCNNKVPILQFVRKHAHDRITINDAILEEITDRALWFDNPNNLLICSFRLGNFRKTRYAPWEEIKKVVAFIVGWLLDEEIALSNYQPVYRTGVFHDISPLEERIQVSAVKAINWFENAEIVLEKGKGGALEGFGTELYYGGSQRKSNVLRADCIGEISLPYFLDYLLHGNLESLQISDNLADFVFENYLYKGDGDLFGMMRWTNEAWGICYQDDVARAIIPQLLKCFYHKTDKHLDDCVIALKFLVKTTGTDGTRVARTDNIDLNKEKLQELKANPGNLPSAHYNAHYFAALLLAYNLTGIEEFKVTAVRGLSTIMSVYPNTKREQSETQEYCRLILPLSWLYWITGTKQHKDWLYQVTHDLEKYRHHTGGYLERDSGYKANMRHEVGEGESSLLTKNGDPVVDLLYSNNWLPIGFIQAYLVTEDNMFKERWESIASFLMNTQIQSENPQINGAWARAFDVEKKEVFGSPADVGWGPWAIESGWTVAQISGGLFMGLLEKQLLPHY